MDNTNIKSHILDSSDGLERLKEKAKKEGAIVFKAPDEDEKPERAYQIDTEKLWRDAFSMRKYMLSCRCKPSLEEVKEKYKSIYDGFPKVFTMIYSGHNLEFLRNMLDRIKNIQNGSSFEDESKELGQQIFDKYVKPNIDKK